MQLAARTELLGLYELQQTTFFSLYVSKSFVNGAITFLSVGSLKCASSFVSQTASDGQNDAAVALLRAAK